jgi:hypothetical protein
MKIRNYLFNAMWSSTNGFTVIFEKDGEESTYSYSTITEKFYYVFGKKQPKLPNYLQSTLVEMAKRKGVIAR